MIEMYVDIIEKKIVVKKVFKYNEKKGFFCIFFLEFYVMDILICCLKGW